MQFKKTEFLFIQIPGFKITNIDILYTNFNSELEFLEHW